MDWVLRVPLAWLWVESWAEFKQVARQVHEEKKSEDWKSRLQTVECEQYTLWSP